jgi:hypothetical protein
MQNAEQTAAAQAAGVMQYVTDHVATRELRCKTAWLTRRNRLLTCRSQSAWVLRYQDESRERQATDAPLKVNSRHARWISRAHAHALARGSWVVGMTATQLKKCGIDARYVRRRACVRAVLAVHAVE